MNPRNAVFAATLLLGIAADQASKAWVIATIEPNRGEIHLIPGWFSFVHAHNTGAAFSTMEGQRSLFLVFTVIAVIVVADLVRRLPPTTRFMPLTLGLILAGAIGNGIDRAWLGHVTDFLKVYAGHEPLRSWFVDRFGTNVWPIFNIADSLLVVGVVLFGLYWLILRDADVDDLTDEGSTQPD